MKTFESFLELTIPEPIKNALHEMNFLFPTAIQAQAIPAALSGQDVVGTAPTGTGKTVAFAIPLLAKLYSQPGKQGLILAPTRELATQIYRVMRQLGKGASICGALVVGGESFRRQVKELGGNIDYIVATPGRLKDHLFQGTIDLSNVCVLVLDEVDRMLDMGFLPQLKEILKHVPKTRQTMLFSATIPADIKRFVAPVVSKAVYLMIGDCSKPSEKIDQKVRRVMGGEKTPFLFEELERRSGKVLVFVRTKSRTHRLIRLLERRGFPAVYLHGGRSQAQRKHALEKFKKNKCRIMVAADLAGRGLDIPGVDHVINYDAPSTYEDYIHRIGRTGRLEKKGNAVSFVEWGSTEEEKAVSNPGAFSSKKKEHLSFGIQKMQFPQGKERVYGVQTDIRRWSPGSVRSASFRKCTEDLGI